jgi:hypothetical protein
MTFTTTASSPSTASTARRPRLRVTRQSIVGFVAGLAVATTLAVGINVTTGDDARPAPVSPAGSLQQPSERCFIHAPC